MCLAAIAVCWGMVFLWQSDVRQWQCDSYPWVVYLPASYLVQLNNMKAYRLSTFLNAVDRRPKPFSHMKVLKLTLMSTLVTILVLIIISISDPLERKVVVVDQYRASLTYYYCKTGMTTTILLYMLVVGHIITSIICIIEVRNGFEAFRDGMIIKEAFIILYACLLVSVIMASLGLSASMNYLVRTSCICIGVTLFCLRILISRCAKHWTPEILQSFLSKVQKSYIDPLFRNATSSVAHAGGSNVRNSSVYNEIIEENDAPPVYVIEIPADNNLNEMLSVLSDPVRCALLENVAKQAHCTENLTFLRSVLDFKKKSAELLSKHSAVANDEIKRMAKMIVDFHVVSTGEEEVNLSSRTRTNIDLQLKDWMEMTPLISPEKSKVILDEDDKKRCLLFETAFKEISIMLYQNIWNKFRASETTEYMASTNKNKVKSLGPEF